MPRIPPTLLRHARRIDPLLPSLLPVCRDLRSSQNELRWLAEHAAEVASKRFPQGEQYILRQFVARRAKGEPLQYIMGTEFFGDLEIKCRPGVLIPRQETAASVSHLAKLLCQTWKKQPAENPVSVLDLCTGTGCIPLLFHHELFKHGLQPNVARIVGVDISPDALALAEENKSIQLHEQGDLSAPGSDRLRLLRNVQFVQSNVLSDDMDDFVEPLLRLKGRDPPMLDYEIITCNPPYISSSAYRKTTEASVRKFEPKLALVPPPRAASPDLSHTAEDHELDDGDLFYPKVLEIASMCDTRVMLFEVADMEQACRVARMVDSFGWPVEIWRDDPEAPNDEEFVDFNGSKIRVYGQGNGRSVVVHTDRDTDWLRG